MSSSSSLEHGSRGRARSSLSYPNRVLGTLYAGELYWRDLYLWLSGKGYTLRSRYHPDWIPSWKDTNKEFTEFEDGQAFEDARVADAIRVSDGKFVALKIIDKQRHPDEIVIARFLSPHDTDISHNNHCAPVLDAIDMEQGKPEVLLVMPLLRAYDDPRFDTLGEVVEFFRQIFEGVQYMHKQGVAHRDISCLNVMMDPSPLFPIPYHPGNYSRRRDWKGKSKHLTRTQKPVKYYFIDFGYATRYPLEERNPLEIPKMGGDKTLPELSPEPRVPTNPFKADIYCLGNLIREEFLQKVLGLEFMNDLVAEMVQDEPSKRPTIDEVVTRFDTIRVGLGSWKLRSRFVKKDDHPIFGFFRFFSHWWRRIIFILTRKPALPTPNYQ